MASLRFLEHESKVLNEDEISCLRECRFVPTGYMQKPKYLGLCWESQTSLLASYYIGASWLVENETSVVVSPKMENIDFVEMFITALAVDSDPEVNYFSKCYGIDFDAPKISVDKNLCQVTPLILLHYITLLEKLVKRGLKKGYVNQEENLNSKIRGQIYVPAHIQRNVCPQREDRAYCRFQEYTEDVPENRLLKKALNFAYRGICSYKSFNRYRVELQSRMNRLFAAFANVSSDIEVHQVSRISHNKLFRHYSEAIRVAKMLLRHFDNSIQRANNEESYETAPFWIDMARLFELYTYSKLSEKYPGQIRFQVSGNGGVCDYLKVANENSTECLIMDAKYKPKYEGKGIEWTDIQEISGYARDVKILEELGWLKDKEVNTQDVPPCVVIYPEYDDEIDTFGINLLDNAEKLSEYTNFHKIAIKVPKLQ
ncbi:MAG: McrC family protein [Bacteroidales bacterium]|nr:McrC family protein [Bacteroidales bacterium]